MLTKLTGKWHTGTFAVHRVQGTRGTRGHGAALRRMKLPEQGGNLCFPVLQERENGTAEWTQVPGDGQTLRDLKSPAAELELLAAPAGHVHAH